MSGTADVIIIALVSFIETGAFFDDEEAADTDFPYAVWKKMWMLTDLTIIECGFCEAEQ